MENMNWVPPRNESSSQLPKILLSALRSPGGLKPPFLKRFYCLLLRLSSTVPLNDAVSGSSSTFWLLNVDPCQKVSFEDICFISNVLSDGVSKMFKQIMSILSADPLMKDSDKATVLDCVEILKLHIRCCMILLNFFEENQHKLLFHTRVLLDILEGFCSFSSSEPSEECVPLLCTMLEVFVDELSVSRRLRRYFKLTDSYFNEGKRLFKNEWSHDNAGVIIELISAQFCALFSNEQAFETFLGELFDIKVSELSLTAVASLLLNPVLFSAPKLFLAYIASLASKAVVNSKGLNYVHPDIYLSILDKAVTVYSKNFSTMQLTTGESSAPKFNCNRQSSDFLCCIQPVTRDRIYKVVDKLDNYWKLKLHKTTKSDLLASSIAYVKESIHLVVNTQYKDEIISVLTQLICNASAVKVEYMSIDIVHGMPQDMYLLASSLDFVNSSFLQVLQYLVQFRNMVPLQNFLNVIQSFGNLGICLSNQKILNDMFGNKHPLHMEAKMMFVHFYGLLSLSFDASLDFLVKGCILTIAALLNLFAFEEGSLLSLRPFINDNAEILRHGQSSEIGVDHASSLVLASKFLKIQKLCLSLPSSSCSMSEDVHLKGPGLDASPIINDLNGFVRTEEESSELTCKGDVYLDCMMRSDKKRPADFDDLADFIECKKGKDYSSWLKNWEKYRRQKYERKAGLRWERKKKAWKEGKGRRI